MMRLLALLIVVLAASPVQARPARAPVQPPSEPTAFLSTETAHVLGPNQTVLSVGLGIANYNAEVVQLHRGLGPGEAMGHIAFIQVPGPINSGFGTTQINGVSAGGGYKYRLGTLGPFETAIHGYTGVFMVGRPAVPLLLTLPLTVGGATFQPRVLLPDMVGGNPFNAASAGLTLAAQLPSTGAQRFLIELTPAYHSGLGRLTYQGKVGLRMFWSPSLIFDFHVANDEYGVGIHPAHPENGMFGLAVRGSF